MEALAETPEEKVSLLRRIMWLYIEDFLGILQVCGKDRDVLDVNIEDLERTGTS